MEKGLLETGLVVGSAVPGPGRGPLISPLLLIDTRWADRGHPNQQVRFQNMMQQKGVWQGVFLGWLLVILKTVCVLA